MKNNWLNIPASLPTRIFTLRESSFASDLFITAVTYLDLFNVLAENPSDIDTLCHSLKIQQRPADVMLSLFKAYGLIKEKNKIFSLTEMSREYLIDKSAFDLTSYVSSLKNRPVCRDIQKVLRTGKPANWAAAKNGNDWAASMEDPQFAESFTAGMNSRGAYLAQGLARKIDLQGHKSLLDIGGASGIYSAVLLNKHPHLHATVFEKSPADAVSRYSIKGFGLSRKIAVVSGDMFKDSFPSGYDVHFLSHVLHDWDLPEIKTILKNSFRTLNPGGLIVIHDAHLNKSKTGPISVAEYSVLLMFLTQGKCYSVGEMQAVLEETGFHNVIYTPTVLNRSLITATK